MKRKVHKKRRISDKNAWNVLNRSCSGKARYDSEEAAWAHNDKIYEEYGNDLTPYKCTACGKWHLTNTSQG